MSLYISPDKEDLLSWHISNFDLQGFEPWAICWYKIESSKIITMPLHVKYNYISIPGSLKRIVEIVLIHAHDTVLFKLWALVAQKSQILQCIPGICETFSENRVFCGGLILDFRLVPKAQSQYKTTIALFLCGTFYKSVKKLFAFTCISQRVLNYDLQWLPSWGKNLKISR